MSYLKFDKNLMINLEQSLPKEMLRTNQSGAYHCTTIVDCNTRKQHGLLVVPVPELGNSWHVMLSSLDLTVYQHGAPFNLALHRYRGGVMSPNGHKYIREFDCESVPRTTYRVGGVILTKEKIFISNENRILIRYTLVEANSPTTLRFRPVLAFRDANELCVENNAIDQTIPEINNGVSACLYPGYPRLYMQFSHKPTWTYEPNWYNGFEYVKDLERGVPYCEDLWVPGYFEIPIKKGESIIFSAGLSEVAPKSLAKMYESEIAHRTCRTSFFNCLKNAVKQCYLNEKDGMYLISGYPWGKILARNTFMALPGATIAINHREDFERIADTALNALRNFMATGETDKRINRHRTCPTYRYGPYGHCSNMQSLRPRRREGKISPCRAPDSRLYHRTEPSVHESRRQRNARHRRQRQTDVVDERIARRTSRSGAHRSACRIQRSLV